jgi:hypothetical protein
VAQPQRKATREDVIAVCPPVDSLSRGTLDQVILDARRRTELRIADSKAWAAKPRMWPLVLTAIVCVIMVTAGIATGHVTLTIAIAGIVIAIGALLVLWGFYVLDNTLML